MIGEIEYVAQSRFSRSVKISAEAFEGELRGANRRSLLLQISLLMSCTFETL